MRRALVAAIAVLASTAAFAQPLTSLPPSGDNQKSSVTQHIGPVSVTIDYSSPDVHGPRGEDRRGKIFGTDVAPYGMSDLGFGTCGKNCPWRAGANENTVFTVSHDVKIEGQRLPAGRYGLHMIPDPNEWTIIFSKNSNSWGSYYYDAAEDALRVKVKPAKNEYNEWLTYNFIDRKADRATVALAWEDIRVPFTITVDNVTDLHLANLRNELRTYRGFDAQSWVLAARYALQAKRMNEALEWADVAVNRPGIGVENFNALSLLADVQDAAGKTAESKATREKALNHATASPIGIHGYGRSLLQQGKKEEALRVFELNARRFPNVWPVNVGLARGYSAVGRYKDALKHARLAAAQAPDEVNKKAMTDAVAKLEKGQDINQ
jgi:tetratricopeptide (TPR) repeat protein